ncbi:MAG: histidinol-phosphate aminotransferase family protein [Anaerolineae bacterium]|nr:histidinol-phosphate aminotransferase family protein [Anaerolineae bacterium]
MTHKPLSPRPTIMAVSPDRHGALDHFELESLGYHPDEILDFSANINAYGPPPGIREAIAAASIERYPDRESLALRRALSECHATPIEQIVLGNGAAELVWLIAFAFVCPQDAVVIAGPTFGEYARCAALMGGRVQTVEARAEDAFKVSPEHIEQALRLSPRLFFLCNPNNPTGAVLDPDRIAGWAAAYPATLFVIDEAYLEFAPDIPSTFQYGLSNILVLRSMTKSCAIAGLRLGYALGHPTIIDGLSRSRPPWNVNVVAQAAGLAALADDRHMHDSIAKLRRDKEKLVAGLAELGLPTVSSTTHYFIVDVADGAQFRRRLLTRHIQVRDCASFGLSTYARIAGRRPDENTRLLAAIEETKG